MSNTNELKRKCAYCKQDFYINRQNINDAIYYGKSNYHSKCFIDMCNKRSQSTRIDTSRKWNEILQKIEQIKDESYKYINRIISRDEIFKFIQQNYHIVVVPSFIWNKLGNIYNGSYKGMSVGIPPEQLLDMWKRKISMLNKLADKNKSIGKSMTAEQRINYDLSVLINKYDSYLKWLEKQKIIEAEKHNDKQLNTEENLVQKVNVKKSNVDLIENDENNLSDIVDDIFG